MESAGSETLTHRSSPSPPARDDGGKPANQRPGHPQRNSIIPPYWQRHERTASSQSVTNGSADSSRPAPILMEDHSQEGSEQCKALWARHVTIDDYVIVSGTAPGIGAYVVWNCTVETLDVSLSKTRGGGMVLHMQPLRIISTPPFLCY
jgi:hypothetical protein